MKKLLSCIVLLVLTGIYLISCEKDDICPETTPTTPNMIVSFYQDDNRSEYRQVTNLQYYEVGNEQDTISVGSVDSTFVPLRVNAESTKWVFIYNMPRNNDVLERKDTIEFKYSVWQEYVSRACGYKTQFLLDPDNPSGSNPVLTAGPDTWIRGVEIVKDSIIDENQAHVKIYF